MKPYKDTVDAERTPHLTGLEIMECIAELRKPGASVYLDDEGQLVTRDGKPAAITAAFPDGGYIDHNGL
jgi:hypothetical protein